MQGQVVADDTGEPVPGAMVVLAGPDGARRGTTLADSLGRYRITARQAGTFTLTVERVGYATPAPDTVTLAAGQTVQRALGAGARQVTLPEVAASARNRCAGLVEANPLTAVVWEEARKALAAAVLMEESGGYRFAGQVERRELYLRGRGVMSYRRWAHVSDEPPFATLPAERLVDDGYVHFERDSLILYGLSPSTVLSEPFRQRHCVGVRDAGAERVWLEFVPLRANGLPDVRGVLWLDRATGELRTLEYTYTGLTFLGPTERIGGELHFHRLPDGAWIVSRWAIRAPCCAATRSGSSPPT